MKLGEQFITEITSFDNEGRGICRIDGFAIFVENAVLGDEVSIEITKLNKTYGFGKLIKLLKKSPSRIRPACPYFEKCGACSLLHISYEKQLEMKSEIVKNAMEHIGRFSNITVAKTVGMEEPFYYRNKSQFPVCVTDKNFAIGFYQKNSHKAIDMKTCLMSSHISMKIANFLREFMKTHHIKAYNEKSHQGCIRHLFVRTTTNESEAMVVVVTNSDSFPKKELFVRELVTKFPQVVSLYQNINDKKTNLIMGRENRLLYGEKVLYDNLLGKKFMISPHSFYQINHKQTEKLYQKAIDLGNISKEDTVFDLYCGIGTISLCLADRAKKVIGVEVVKDAIENAKTNAEINAIFNAEFYVGTAESVVPKLYEAGERADVVMLDPPRKGADPLLLQTILDMKPKRIVYVSCNPATLARDARILADGGYGFDTVYPFDMFCHTGHVETVVLMSRVDE